MAPLGAELCPPPHTHTLAHTSHSHTHTHTHSAKSAAERHGRLRSDPRGPGTSEQTPAVGASLTGREACLEGRPVLEKFP